MMKSRVKIIKNLLEAIFEYISEDYTDYELERHRDRLHEIVNDVCDEFKDRLRGLSDV